MIALLLFSVFFLKSFCFAEHKEEKLSYSFREVTVSTSFHQISVGSNRRWLRIENVGNSVVFISTQTKKSEVSKSSVTLNSGELFSTYDDMTRNAFSKNGVGKLKIVEGK